MGSWIYNYQALIFYIFKVRRQFSHLKCIILAVTESGFFLFSVLDYLALQDNFTRHMVRRDESFTSIK